MSQPTEESFLKDVANHSMKILKDDGVYRHLQFSNNGSWNQRFDIVTWPGYLAYSGDMGCFVFSRLADMFEFFRTDRRDKEHLGINLSYWSEKLEAVDRDGRSSSATQFSPEKFRDMVDEQIKEWIEDYNLSEEASEELRDEVNYQIMSRLDDGEESAHQNLNEFSYSIDGTEFEFQDTWEWNFDEYTYRFIWCCYALAWGIQMYDKAKEDNVQA
jgi:predicted DNA-binding protein